MISTVRLEDVLELVAMGPFGSDLKVENFTESGVPVIRGGNLGSFHVSNDGLAFVSEEKAETLARSLALPGDLVITHRGTLGQISMVPREGMFDRYLVSQSQMLVRPDTLKAHPEYLTYWLRSPAGQGALMAYSVQTGVPALAQPTKSIKSLQIPLPPLAVQKAIGEVLGALDDKIAANHRLQSLAIDQISALARAAASTVRLGEVASLHRNSLAPGSFGAENVWHYSLPSFDEGKVRLEASSGIMSAKHRLDRPVVLVSKLNPRIPRVWPVMRLKEGVSVTSPEFMAMAPTQGFSVASLTAALRSEQFTTSLLSLVAGTTGSHQRVKPMEVMELGIPDMRTLSRAALETIEALELMSVSSSEENTTLARTRDELLPQLMSGRITVKDAEKRVEEEV